MNETVKQVTMEMSPELEEAIEEAIPVTTKNSSLGTVAKTVGITGLAIVGGTILYKKVIKPLTKRFKKEKYVTVSEEAIDDTEIDVASVETVEEKKTSKKK